MGTHSDGSQKEEDRNFRIFSSIQDDTDQIVAYPEEELEKGGGDGFLNASGSVSFSSLSSTQFISISTRQSESNITDYNTSPAIPESCSELSSFESSSGCSIATLPEFLDSEPGISDLSSRKFREAEHRSRKWIEGFSPKTSDMSLEELFPVNLAINGIILKNLNDLMSTYSGDLLFELTKLELRPIVVRFFRIYSRDYYQRNLPLICSFISVLFELSFSENKLRELNVEMWEFFECIIGEISSIFGIKEGHELPHIPVVYWMVKAWNKYDMFLAFKPSQEKEEELIKNHLNEILFSLHLGKNSKTRSHVSKYYSKLLASYKQNDELHGYLLYVIKLTKFLFNNFLMADNLGRLEINSKGILDILNNFNQHRTQVFSKTLDILISNSKANSNEHKSHGNSLSNPIPVYLFSSFFLLNGPKKILQDIAISICNNNSLKFEDKKQSFIHIIDLIMHACKATSLGGSPDVSNLDLLMEMFELEIWEYLGREGALRIFMLLDGVIRDLTERVNLVDSNKSDSGAISRLYKLQGVLLVKNSDLFAARTRRECRNAADPGGDDWRRRLIDAYLASNEMDKGIRNLGNTCYLNSIIQCLSLSYYFLEWVCDNMIRGSLKSNKLIRYLFKYLINLLDPADKGSNGAISARGYVGESASSTLDMRLIDEISSQFALGKEHDACDFLRYLLSNISGDCLPFVMTIKESSECLSCGVVESKQSQSLSIIDLYVSKDLLFRSKNGRDPTAGTVTLESLIECHFSTDKFPNSLECRNCRRMTAFKASNSIKKPSRYVVLAIHNYYWDRRLNMAVKQTDFKVKFDDFFLLDSHKYVIYALIFHQGKSTYSGHYFAIGRKHFYDSFKQRNPKWFKYNDQTISNIESLHQFQKFGENPYLIFAILVD
ncbi:ubiquitin C-terminal hydrolase of the cysteine proteinase fold [Cryptosporidium canis]|nr:ubiquitin C-terminal hydrolase of the cysteine proteinase fold [Cryptosporidium canis]